MEFELFKNFGQLVDSLENLNYSGKKAIFKIENATEEYNFIASTLHGHGGPPFLKFKNILIITNDSLKKDDLYSIDSLNIILKKDLLNFGGDDHFSDSPENLMVSITADLSELENLIIKVFKSYNQIKSESKDSIKLNIFLNRRLGLDKFPPLPSNE